MVKAKKTTFSSNMLESRYANMNKYHTNNIPFQFCEIKLNFVSDIHGGVALQRLTQKVLVCVLHRPQRKMLEICLTQASYYSMKTKCVFCSSKHFTQFFFSILYTTNTRNSSLRCCDTISCEI